MTDVRMPDGTVIKNVPDGVTQAQLSGMLAAHSGKQQSPAEYSADHPLDDFAASPLGAIAHGAVETMGNVEQAVPKALSYVASLGGNIKGPISDFMDRLAAKSGEINKGSESAYTNARARTGHEGFDAGRLIGNIASPANFAGGRLAAELPEATTLLGRILQGGSVGAGIGAATSPEGSRRTGAVLGGTVGAGLPALLAATGSVAAPVIDKVAEVVSPAAQRTRAIQAIVDHVKADEGYGGPSLAGIRDKMTAAAKNGQPLAMADVSGESVRGLGEGILNQPGPARSIGAQLLLARDKAAQQGALQDLERYVSPLASKYDTVQSLIAQRSAQTRGPYEEAFSGGSIAPLQDQLRTSLTAATGAKGQIAKQIRDIEVSNPGALAARGAAGAEVRAKYIDLHQRLGQAEKDRQATLDMFRTAQSDVASNKPGAVWSPRIQQFLDDPILKSGISRGLEIQRLESLSEGRHFDPTEYATVGSTPDGAAVVGKVPNMRLLDAGKRGLDAIIADNKVPFTGKLTDYGRAVDSVRRSYLNELDSLNPDYAAARQSHATPSRQMDAVNNGSKFLTKEPEEISADLERLNDTEKEMYRLGGASALRSKVLATRDGANEANRIGGSELDRKRISALIGDTAKATQYLKAVENRNAAFQTKADMLGNSRAALRQAAQDVQRKGDGMMNAVEVGAGLLTHNPLLTAAGAARSARSINNLIRGPNAATRAEIARILFSTPDSPQGFMGQIEAPPILPGARFKKALSGSTLPATIPLVSLLSQMSSVQQGN